MNNIDSKSHIWFYFDLHQGNGLFLMDKLGTQAIFKYTYFKSSIKYLSLSQRIIVNLTTGKLLLFLLRWYERERERICLWFIFYNIKKRWSIINLKSFVYRKRLKATHPKRIPPYMNQNSQTRNGFHKNFVSPLYTHLPPATLKTY